MLITNMTFNGLIQSELAHSRSIIKCVCALTQAMINKIQLMYKTIFTFVRMLEYNGKCIFV